MSLNEQIQKNTEDLKQLETAIAEPSKDESTFNIGSKISAKLKKIDEKVSETLSVCKDPSTQKHVVWTNLVKYIFQYIKYTLVVQAITTFLSYVIGANGLPEMLILLKNLT